MQVIDVVLHHSLDGILREYHLLPPTYHTYLYNPINPFVER